MASFSAAAALALGGAYALLGAAADAWVAVATAFGSCFILLVFKFTSREGVTRSFALTWFLAEFLTAAISTGVMTYLSWVAVLILVAFFLGGPTEGSRWALVIGVALAAAGVVMIVAPSAPAPVSRAVELLRIFSLTPIVAAYGYLFEVARVKNATDLEAARSDAQHASDAKGRLLSKVSHEIRTPLNGVLGLTEALLSRPLPAAVTEDLELIHRSGTGLLALINDLLDISRAEAGKIELAPSSVNLSQVLKEVSALHRSAAELKGLSLLLEGTTSPPIWVRVDEGRLRQILGNLVSNAIKFTATGQVALRMQCRLTAGRVETTIAVEDSGTGLAPESLRDLFQPFKQFHAQQVKGGTGLGLAISRELAHAMGGRLVVTSELGKGSTFCLSLLLDEAEPPIRDVRVVEKLEPFAALVVDDNLINRRVAQSFITLLGGTVIEAADGVESVRLASERPFDIVLMDVHMPNMDGLEATTAIRAAGVLTPIVGLTAAVGVDTVAECLEVGMVACVAKPLQLAVLRAELLRLIPARRRTA